MFLKLNLEIIEKLRMASVTHHRYVLKKQGVDKGKNLCEKSKSSQKTDWTTKIIIIK